MKTVNTQNDLDRIIGICKEYKDLFSGRYFWYGNTPDDIIQSCEKLKALGYSWGDPLPRGHFRMTKKYYLSNSATGFQPEENTYYIEWDNGNVGRLQFVGNAYWHYVDDEWDAFLSKLLSYNPVDCDPLNCHIIYDVENGKRVIADYEYICDKTREEMQKKIRAVQIERKKAELEKLISEQESTHAEK